MYSVWQIKTRSFNRTSLMALSRTEDFHYGRWSVCYVRVRVWNIQHAKEHNYKSKGYWISLAVCYWKLKTLLQHNYNYNNWHNHKLWGLNWVRLCVHVASLMGREALKVCENKNMKNRELITHFLIRLSLFIWYIWNLVCIWESQSVIICPYTKPS